MSVLSFPRIYFQGFMCWDPATGNNNDYFPTYDDVHATLNWAMLKTQGIDQSNFREKFRPWEINNETVEYPPGQTNSGIPGEWNYFGGNGSYFVQYADKSKGIDRKSTITGGVLDLGKPVASDPLFGTPLKLLGDPFGSPGPGGPGRLVDNNPVSVYSSQIFYNSMTFGNADAGIEAQRAVRMQSRFINFTRNYYLTAAGGASVTWQACFPAGQGLKINTGKSSLLKALQAEIASGRAQGIMVRFNSYLNLYFQNGYFNDFHPQPATVDDLPAMYQAALDGKTDLFSNPCYSRIVGLIGPWYHDELASCPEGRYLVPPANVVLCNPQAPSPCWDMSATAVDRVKSAHDATAGTATGDGGPINVPQVPKARQKTAAQLGVALAEIDYQRNVISLDLLNTFPELSWQGTKADFKDIAVGVQSGSAFSKIATLSFSSYGEAGYQHGGGIADLPFDPKLAQQIRDGALAFQVQPSVWVAEPIGPGKYKPTDIRTVLVEQPFTAQTDRRSIYLNEGEGTEFKISVKYKGKPAPGASLLVVKYNASDDASASVDAIPANGPQVVDIANGQIKVITVQTDGGQSVATNATIVQADNKGSVTLGLRAANPGFPVLVFYPYGAGQSLPAPPGSFDEVGTAMFTTVRILSFDDAFVDQFVQLWNSTLDPAKAWDFIYGNILYLYDMIFPVMLKFVPLGDRQRVEGAIDQVLALIAPSYFAESTLAMPITRDLSAGKRTVLQLWGGLVKKNYPPQPIKKPTAPIVS
jgi:hypothetical protein